MVIFRPRMVLSSRLGQAEQIGAAIVGYARRPCRWRPEGPWRAIISWLLPEPDSPTMATVSPAFTSRFTPLTASTIAIEGRERHLDVLERRGWLASISAVLRVKRIAQAVADEVQGEQRGGQEEGREDQQPGGAAACSWRPARSARPSSTWAPARQGPDRTGSFRG